MGELRPSETNWASVNKLTWLPEQELQDPRLVWREDMILLFHWRLVPATLERGFEDIQLISRVGKGLGHFLFKSNFQLGSLQFIS